MATKDKKFSNAQIAKQLVKEAADRAFGKGAAARAAKAARKSTSKGVRIPGAKHRND